MQLSRAAALCIWLALLSGCGSVIGTDRPGLPATLALEGMPGAQHAGIYLATSRGYDLADGVQLELEPPAEVGSGARRLVAGDVDQALMSARELARARERGADLVAVAALQQRATNPAEGPLLLCVARAAIDEDRAVIRATIRALGRGYSEAQRDPESAVAAIRVAVPELDEKRAVVRLRAISDSFSAGAAQFGQLPPQRLVRWVKRDALVTDLGR